MYVELNEGREQTAEQSKQISFSIYQVLLVSQTGLYHSHGLSVVRVHQQIEKETRLLMGLRLSLD